MKTSRMSLRTRLVISMLAVALGVLGVSYVATYTLVRRSLQDNALKSLRQRSTDLAADRERREPRHQRAHPQARVGSDGPPADRVRPNGQLVTGAVQGNLPSTFRVSDIEPSALFNGSEVSGRRRSTVYLAIPTDKYVGQARVVVVATDTVDFTVLRRLFPFLIVIGLIVLAIAFAGRVVARAAAHASDRRDRTRRATAGDRRPHCARATVPDTSDGELAALATTLNDMAAQLDSARGSERAFLMSVSHDLRTPLTSIRGYAEALADGTLDDADPDERLRAATVIGSEARRLERLVRDLLDLSRLDSHQFSLSPRGIQRDRSRARRRDRVLAESRRAGYPIDGPARTRADCQSRRRPSRPDRRQPCRERPEVRGIAGRGVRLRVRTRTYRDRCGRRRSRHSGRPDRTRVRPSLHGARNAGAVGWHRPRPRDRARAHRRNGRPCVGRRHDRVRYALRRVAAD